MQQGRWGTRAGCVTYPLPRQEGGGIIKLGTATIVHQADQADQAHHRAPEPIIARTIIVESPKKPKYFRKSPAIVKAKKAPKLVLGVKGALALLRQVKTRLDQSKKAACAAEDYSTANGCKMLLRDIEDMIIMSPTHFGEAKEPEEDRWGSLAE